MRNVTFQRFDTTESKSDRDEDTMRRLNRKKDDPKKEDDIRSKVDRALVNMMKMF